MNCPYCGASMEYGYLIAKHPILWSPNRYKATIFAGKEDVKLAKTFGDRAVADLCRKCRKVVLTY